MRAYVLRAYEGPKSLRLEELADPVPGPEEVLVRIEATALNRPDLLQTLGRYPGPPMDVEIPGLELAGTVIATGPRAHELRAGDRVMGLVTGGAFAEAIAVHQRLLVRVPPELDLLEAAGILESGVTAFDALILQADLRRGEKVLVHAAASGIGTAALVVARLMGARAVATCSACKAETIRPLGPELVVDYTSESFVERVLAWSPTGVDVVFDPVGGSHVAGDLKVAAPKARIIVLGLLGGRTVELDLSRLLGRRLHLAGTVLRGRPLEERIVAVRRFAREVPLTGPEAYRPLQDSVIGFDELPQGLERMAKNLNAGKILVRVR